MKRVLCLLLSLIFILNSFVISASAKSGSANTDTVLITGITRSDPKTGSFTLAVRQSRRLIINVSPKNATGSVEWSVGDKKIATVSSDGVVTGKKAGKTTVTAAATDGSNKKVTYTVTITKRETGNNLNANLCSVVNTTKSKYNYKQLKTDLAGLKEKYPYIFDYVSLGKSYDSRNIYEIILGNRNSKKKVFIQATMHAREYINTVLVMEQAEALCANYYTGTYDGKYYSELLENCCLYIVPMANPDGVAISIYGADGIVDEVLHSDVVKMCKDYGNGKSSYYKYWKANARGVDLNRNWDCNWANKEGADYACSENYNGPYPESEKETKIIKKEIETLKPDVIISYHSNGEVIYWDFLQSGNLQKQCYNLFKTVNGLTGYASAENPSADGAKPSEDLYPCFGDWVAHIKKTPTLTIETGTATCPMEAKHFPDIWKKNQHVLPAVAYFTLYAEGWTQFTDGHWEYISNGVNATGFTKINNKWYYFDAYGVMQTGWIQYKNNWYYLNAKGAMQTGWLKYKNNWYYLNTKGAMKTGWLEYKNNWYYFKDNGAMKTGWLNYKDNWYYLDANGSMKTGWLEYRDNWYYLDENGKMLTDQWVNDRYLDSDGIWREEYKKMCFNAEEVEKIELARYTEEMRDLLGGNSPEDFDSLIIASVSDEESINTIILALNGAAIRSKPLTDEENSNIASELPYALIITQADGKAELVSFFGAVELAVFNESGSYGKNVYFELDSGVILDCFELN